MHPLNPFPELLTYRILIPTLLRVAAAIIFAYLAYRHYERREAISRVVFPIIGRGMWISWLAIIVEIVVAAALFFGYYTQIAAIIGGIGALKQWVWRGKFPAFFWLTRSASFLLLIICLALLIGGAGAFAFDLPL
jgi:uncharacterized membrane protein YphA (DoxX/SURF4 family)